jgi:hypothetical protein
MWLRTSSRDYRCTPYLPWALIDVDSNDLVAAFRSPADVTKNRVFLESLGPYACGRSATEVYEVAVGLCESIFCTRQIGELPLGDFGNLITVVAKELRR